ncbi:MAG: hypothetical protein IT324_20450 [Anaerolineae bacterium]|nr:hypothetical protein [Anaerolineae bacterium]
MHNRWLWPLLVLLIALLAWPAVPTVAQGASWREGVFVAYGQPIIGVGSFFQLTGVKTVTQKGEAISEKTAYVTLGIVCRNATGQPDLLVQIQTVKVGEDPDLLSASHDLGWGGLDTTVTTFDIISQQDVPVTIHLSWLSTGGVTREGSLFRRGATVQGYLETPQCRFDFTPQTPAPEAYVYSTREPLPDEEPVATAPASQ